MATSASCIRLLAAILLTGNCTGQQAASPSPEASVGESATPTFGTTVVIPSGLRGLVYRIPKGSWALPDFEKLEPVGAVWTARLNLAPRHWKNGIPGVTKQFEWFAIDYSGRFWIDKPGVYRFALLSDDGSKLFIDNDLVIDNDCRHPPIAQEGSVELKGGIHRMRVAYFQGPRDCIALTLSVAGPEEDWRIFSTEEFKPPANPKDWKFGDPNELNTSPDPEVSRRKLRDLLKKPPKKRQDELERAAPSSAGCWVSDPIPRCHP